MWAEIERDVRPQLVLVVWRCSGCRLKACTVGRAAATHPWAVAIGDAPTPNACRCGVA